MYVCFKDFIFVFTTKHKYQYKYKYGTPSKLPGCCASEMMYLFRGQTAIPLAALAVSSQPRTLLASITKFSHLLWKVSKQLFVS